MFAGCGLWCPPQVLQTFGQLHYSENAARCLHLCGGSPGSLPDLLVANLTAWDVVLPLAEGLSAPFAFTAFAPPVLPTPDHPPVLLHPRPLPLACLNVAAAHLAQQLIRRMLGHHEEEVWCFQQLSGCPQPTPVDLMIDRVRHAPHLLTYSQLLSPLPRGWDKEAAVVPCGPLLPRMLGEQQQQHWQSAWNKEEAAAQLQKWLLDTSSSATGDDEHKQHQGKEEEARRQALLPVYVGFGSMMPQPARLARATLEALRSTGRRGILQRGWAGLSGGAEEREHHPWPHAAAMGEPQGRC